MDTGIFHFGAHLQNQNMSRLTFREVLRTIHTIRSKSYLFFQILLLRNGREIKKDSPDYFMQKQVGINEQQITKPLVRSRACGNIIFLVNPMKAFYCSQRGAD